MRTVQDVVSALNETSEWEEEWGQKVFAVISAYNTELQRKTTDISRARSTKVVRTRDDSDTLEEYQPRAKRLRMQEPLAEISNVRRSTRLAKNK
jgi:hypothetical protein